MNFFIPTIEHVKDLQDIFKNNQKMACEMSVGNTILWSKYYQTEIAIWQDEIVFRSKVKENQYSYAANLMSAKNPYSLFHTIIEQAKMDQMPFRMHCVLREEMDMIDTWYPNQYFIQWGRDESDYIYSREKLATLSGKKMHSKRNHIHRFEEENPNWTYERITDDNENECVEMAIAWCMKNCKDYDNDIDYEKVDESKLVVYAIRHRKAFNLIGGALRVKGKIIAIALGEELTKDTFVVHFEKAFSEIQGAYPLINREFVRNELLRYDYVNREEDMGLEGLRKAKLSYHPEILLNKGIVRRNH